MANEFFKFKQFIIHQENCGMKVGTDAVMLGAWADIDGCTKILDVGTGTGIIAIMLAQRSNAGIDAVEIEVTAYKQAIQNTTNCSWAERLKVYHISFQDFSDVNSNLYDHIVSNPPYFVNSLKTNQKTRNIARHTDTLPYSSLLDGSLKLLSYEGKLSVILPYAEGSVFIVEAAKRGLFCNKKTNIKTVPNAPIKRLLLEFSKTANPLQEDYIVIGTGQHEQYSEKYKELTKEFYLAF